MSSWTEEHNVVKPPLDPKQVALLRRTFSQVESQGTIAALVFYRQLFTLDPSLKAMFHTSIELQTRKLLKLLVTNAVVDIGTRYTVTLTPSGSRMFFRLQAP